MNSSGKAQGEGLSWSSFFKRISLIFIISLLINYFWEMAQMPFYGEMPLSDIRSWLMCLNAALGDAGLTLVIFMTGRLLFRSWCWPDRLSAGKIGYLVLSGSLIGVLIEIFALNDNRWEYSSSMPVIPWLGVGAVPFIQMICLPCLPFIATAKIYPCRKKPVSEA